MKNFYILFSILLFSHAHIFVNEVKSRTALRGRAAFETEDQMRFDDDDEEKNEISKMLKAILEVLSPEEIANALMRKEKIQKQTERSSE